MKTQILVTVEVSRDSISTLPDLQLSPARVLGDVNDQLRLWLNSNPYALRDLDALTMRLEFADATPPAVANLKLNLLAEEIKACVRELSELARIAATPI